MDRLPQLLIELLECAEDALSIPVCRSFVNPGPNAPWDNCSTGTDTDGNTTNGQMWIAHLRSTPDFPFPKAPPVPCGPTAWTAQIELGIARCQMGVLPDDQVGMPAAEMITADAALQQADRFNLLQAISCCAKIDERDVLFDRWEPFEPSGGCVASRWVFSVRIGKCPCGELQS